MDAADWPLNPTVGDRFRRTRSSMEKFRKSGGLQEPTPNEAGNVHDFKRGLVKKSGRFLIRDALVTSDDDQLKLFDMCY